MRCTDCNFSKETIPEQVRYVYCTKFKKEMSVSDEFDTCQYEELLIKAMRWFAKVTTYCEDNLVNCRECEFHGFCTDPYSDERIGEMCEWLTQAAALIESMQAELHNAQVHADCMEARAIAYEAELAKSQAGEGGGK